MYVHDDKMVCFFVQNQSHVPPIYSEGNLCTMSGRLTSFIFIFIYINVSMLFSPALPDIISSCYHLATSHMSFTVSEVTIC